MVNDIWQRSLDFLTKNIKQYAVLVAVFLVVLAVAYSIVGTFSQVFLLLYMRGAALIVGSMALFSVWGVLYAFITGAYIFGLKDGISALLKKGQIDYVHSAISGLTTMLFNKKLLLEVLFLGLVSGAIYGILSAFYNYAILAVGQIFSGIAYSLIVLILLSNAYSLNISKFIEKIKSINSSSPNSGLFLILTLGLPIIPLVGALDIFLLAFAVVLLTPSLESSHQAMSK